MTVSFPLHKALASDDPIERRDALMQLALLLGDRIAQLEGVQRQVNLAVQQMDRNSGNKNSDRRRGPRSSHQKLTPSTIESLEALIARP